MNPKVSVIVPVYNCEKYVERCIKSLKNQTLEEIEIILVNDGSTDRSPEICRFFQNENNNIFLINQKNGGSSKAREAGINIARGKYIGFVDSDDWVEADMFRCLYEIAQQENADIVQCDFIRTSDSEHQITHFSEKPSWNIEDANRALSELLCVEDECRFNYLLWNKIYKRSLFSKFRYPIEIQTINDVPVIARLFFYAKKVAYIEEPFVYYFERKDESNKSIMDSVLQSRAGMIFSHVEAFDNVSDFFYLVDSDVYKKSLYLLANWVCSCIVMRKNKMQKELIYDIFMRHRLYRCSYLDIKKRILCLVTYLYLKYRRKSENKED